MIEEELDLRGLKCPLPALLARRALLRFKSGTIIAVLVDDPMAPIDVPHMCRDEGFEILGEVRELSHVRMRLRRPADTGGNQPTS
jgi:tRNA 2-thiouridine synthesizing protein A